MLSLTEKSHVLFTKIFALPPTTSTIKLKLEEPLKNSSAKEKLIRNGI